MLIIIKALLEKCKDETHLNMTQVQMPQFTLYPCS